MTFSFIHVFALFVFGLCCTVQAARLSISVLSDENHNVQSAIISCQSSDIVTTAKQVDLMQILKETSDKKNVMLVHIDRLNNAVQFGQTVKSAFQANGLIDKSVKEDSFLALTFKAPKTDDGGQYLCEVYFTDAAGVLQRTVASANLNIPKPIPVQKDLSGDLKNLQQQIDALTNKLNSQGSEFTKKIEDQSKSYDSITGTVGQIVKEYNYQLDRVSRMGYVPESKLKKELKSLKTSLGNNMDVELAKLNASLGEVKAALEEDLGEIETDADEDLTKHVQTFNSVTKSLARKVSEANNKVTNAENLIGKLAEKISLLSDKVSVLDFLIQASVNPEPETTVKPTKDPVAELLAKVNDLEQRSQNQSQQLTFLLDEDLKAFYEINGLANVTNHLSQAVNALTPMEDMYANMTAFKASLKKPFKPQVGQVIVFDEVMLNKGQGYDKTTGEFTAPRSGIYAFDLVLMTRINDEWVDVDLQANTKVLVRLTSKENEREDQAAVSVVAELRAGDVVQAVVKYTAASLTTKLVHLNFSTFSGYFVQPL